MCPWEQATFVSVGCVSNSLYEFVKLINEWTKHMIDDIVFSTQRYSLNVVYLYPSINMCELWLEQWISDRKGPHIHVYIHILIYSSPLILIF